MASPAALDARKLQAEILRALLCGREIIIEAEGEVVRGLPAEMDVGYGGLADCCDRPAIDARCPYINFFCNTKHANPGPGQIRG